MPKTSFLAALSTLTQKLPAGILLMCLTCAFNSFGQGAAHQLSEAELRSIGQQIYLNETGGNADYLIAWNEGEAFVSLGIGHFIWFPENLQSPFTESFPALVDYLHQQGESLPQWLTPHTDAPWSNKTEFEQARSASQMQQLRVVLTDTFDLQLAFILKRMQAALPDILANIKDHKKQHKIKQRFHLLSATADGVYALVDYVNFKGEGTSEHERYQGQGWGLLQVLERMEDSARFPLTAFSDACISVLETRIANSPAERGEARWLKGWKKRCETYAMGIKTKRG